MSEAAAVGIAALTFEQRLNLPRGAGVADAANGHKVSNNGERGAMRSRAFARSRAVRVI